ncbi:MAG: DUF393 domain-containing protein [Rhodospirillales bacterium]|nr:DUF393 domain-containing protein [Rhodospirillales bacterium]
MKNNWTGGQYSVFRFLFGVTLFVYFIYSSIWSKAGLSGKGMTPVTDFSPALVVWFWIASAFALALAVGCRDRLAAILMMLVLAGLGLVGWPPLASRLDLHYSFLLVGWMLLAHAFMPSAPYGSASAYNRADPGGGWRMPPGLFLASWIVLALVYWSGAQPRPMSAFWMTGDLIQHVLNDPLARDWFLRDIVLGFPTIILQILSWFFGVAALLFAPLCLLKWLHPWLWSIMLSVQIGIGFFLNLPELTIPMLLFHMFTFNPLWLKPISLTGATVFFDGTCALCHGCVRFLLSEEPAGTLKFSPLQGTLYATTVSEAQRQDLGDSFVVVTPDGKMLSEADAAIYLLNAIGGLWRLLSHGMKLVPPRLRNWAYHAVGNRRFRIFGAKTDLCPLTPPEMKDRILI